jgi:YVTN family beta-propeller protein
MQRQKKGSRFATILREHSFRRGLQCSVLTTLVTWFGGPTPAAAQVASGSVPPAAIVYVSNGGGGITEINSANNSVIATAPFPNNANGVVVTPDGRRIYASNRDVGQVTVFDARTNVPLTVISVGNGNDHPALSVTLVTQRGMDSLPRRLPISRAIRTSNK